MSIAEAHTDGTVAIHDGLWSQRVGIISDKLHRQFPDELHGRVEAATALALDRSKVQRDSAGVWQVAATKGGWYPVNGECPCPDFPRAMGNWCKHRLAANIVNRALEVPEEDLIIDPETYDQVTGEVREVDPLPPEQDAWLHTGFRQSQIASPPLAAPRAVACPQPSSRFTKAQKATVRLRMALTGPAGSGKSWTALALASALGERIALIDTEHGGASYYAEHFAFDTLALTSFHPEEYIAAIQAAVAEGYEVLIIDSLSHAWMGKDGALEQVDRAAKRSHSSNSFAAWREVTPLHNKLVEAILAAPLHVIVTLRSKMEYVLEADSKGKQVPKKVGLAPVQRDGVEYEFDVVADLDHQHTLVVTKSRLHAIADKVVDRPDRTFGLQIKQALS